MSLDSTYDASLYHNGTRRKYHYVGAAMVEAQRLADLGEKFELRIYRSQVERDPDRWIEAVYRDRINVPHA